MFRSMSLLARFGMASAALLTVAAVALALTLTHIIEERARDNAEQTAVVAVGLGIAPRLKPAEFAGVVGATDRQLLDAAMAGSALPNQGYDALRLKIYNTSRMVIYSDLEEIIGETHESENIDAALDGELRSETTLLDLRDESDGTNIDPEALEV